MKKQKNHFFIFTIFYLLVVLLIHDSAAAAAAAATPPALTSSSSCPSHCGEIAIPYPFGIGNGCYLSSWYEIQCRNNSGKPVPFLRSINRDVVNISLPDRSYDPYGSVRIKNPITSSGCSSDEEATSPLNLTGSPFFFAASNRLLAVGCNNKALMTDVEPQIMGCESTCDARNSQGGGQNMRCYGYRCCEAQIPDDSRQIIGITIEDVSNNTSGEGCRVAFLTDEGYSPYNITQPERFHDKGYATVDLDWFIDTSNLQFLDSLGCVSGLANDTIIESSWVSWVSCVCRYGYLSTPSYGNCRCNYGYRGNPYIPGGCKDIDECQENNSLGRKRCEGETCKNTLGSYSCVPKKTRLVILGFSLGFGLLLLVIGSWWLYKYVKKRKEMNRRKKFFKRNGGMLLQQQLNATDGNVEKTKIFGVEELENANDKFSKSRILGQGGQGTVYKGMLVDGRIVAVKSSKLIDEDNLEEFINEVVILSQINHRNIVKLLGCCLETEVPILVYEFIPNGNLFEHLHDQYDDYKMTWKVRLRIAIEISGALSYLRSAASTPVYHRDIKSTNILLDEKYRAKVSDFGTSRSVTIDHTHLTTTVTGTFGYMDPEYFRSSQFTDKSDVYSFGVVLVELLTGEKPVSLLRSTQEGRSLAAYFVLTMKEDKLFDIIDSQVKEDCELEEVMAVANLAKRCLSLNAKKRPNMREVSMELERIRSSPKDSKFQIENEEEDETMEIDIGQSWNFDLTASASSDMAVTSSTALLPHRPCSVFHTV